MKDLNKIQIGTNIKNIRELNNVSLTVMSFVIKISSKKIRDVEQGRSLPSVKMLCNLSNYFKISIEDLVSS